MVQATVSYVMDIAPWPRGRGFQGGPEWWDYVLSKEEKQRLDNLMGIALLDTDVRARLLEDRDESLLTAFGLSEEMRARMQSVSATTLVELAQALVAAA